MKGYLKTMNPAEQDPDREARGLLGKETARFGESEYGERLAYHKPVYRNPIFAIAYYIHVIIIIAVGAYLWFTQYPDIRDSTSWQSDVDFTGMMVGIVGCMITGIVFGLAWLEIMKRFASTIIKSMVCGVFVSILSNHIHARTAHHNVS